MNDNALEQMPVSVIVRTQNRPETLAFALQSLVRQSHRPLEAVVVNDGGADVGDLVAQVCADRLDFQYIQLPPSGRCEAGNQGLARAKGALLMFLDDDDWLDPPHIELLVEALGKHPECIAAHAGVAFTASPGAPPTHIFNTPLDVDFLRMENSLPIHSVLFRRAAYDQGCRLDGALDVYEDWDFWLQVSRLGPFHHVDRVTAGYRSGGDSGVGWQQDRDAMQRAWARLIAKWRTTWSADEWARTLQWPKDHWRDELYRIRGELDTTHQAFTQTQAERDHFVRQLDSLTQTHQELAQLHADLNQRHAQSLEAYRDLEQAHLQLRQAHQQLQQAHDLVIRSTSWRITRPLRAINRRLYRLRERVGAQLSSLGHRLATARATLRSALLSSGGALPLLRKVAARVREEGFAGAIARVRLHINSQPTAQRGHRWAQGVAATTDESHPCATPQELLEAESFRLGVMAHVFYPDLFPEFCEYLNHIPVPYRLLVSVTNEAHEQALLEQRHLLSERASLQIRRVPNRGRDIAPLLVGFRDELRELDIVCHIHTKKSAFTGSDAFGNGWRGYLLNRLLGDERLVCCILGQFLHHPGIGFIYPENYPKLSHWANTWLSNRANGALFLQRLGIQGIDFGQYIDYPAGSMFWARTAALKPILDLDLSFEDFPPEQGQTDNTLHHTIERSFLFSARLAGYQTRTLLNTDPPRFAARHTRVLEQYLRYPIDNHIRSLADKAKVVSFDIFDTLLIRPFASPEAVFLLMQEQVAERWGIHGFKDKRQQAEQRLRARLAAGSDVGLTQIHEELARAENLSAETASALCEHEFGLELKTMRPNEPICAVARELKRKGKRVILVSDMYLERRHLDRLLAACGIGFHDAIYLSSEVGLRKDQATLWPHVLQQEGITKDELFHVGDNEQSDIQVLIDRRFYPPAHVMRPAALFGLLPEGGILLDTLRTRRHWRNEFLLGMMANRMMRHLQRHPQRFAAPYQDAELFGYSLLGPLVLAFLTWLIGQAQEDRIDRLMFLSREGWLLQRAYQALSGHPKLAGAEHALPVGQYRYASRTYYGFASIKAPADAELLLGREYIGTLDDLLDARFGLLREDEKARIPATARNRSIYIPPDLNFVREHLQGVLPAIMEQAQAERDLIADYWAHDEQNPSGGSWAIVDIGYTGSIQRALSRCLGQPLTGYYMITNEASQQFGPECGTLTGCFGHAVSLPDHPHHALLQHGLLLESILTAPHGQLKRFVSDDRGQASAEFLPQGKSQRQFATLEDIHDGCLSFITDACDLLGTDVLGTGWDYPAIEALITPFASGAIPLGDLEPHLVVEDRFSGNRELSPFSGKNT